LKGARRQLLEIQKRLVRRIKREIDVSIGALDPVIRTYKREYNSEFRHYHVASKQELIEAILASDIVFLGDYHTLRNAQQTLLKIIEEVLPRRLDIVLALETIRNEDQEILEEYLRGGISEDEFLRKVDYERTWGFPWNYYKPIFDAAKKYDLRIVGINTFSGGEPHTMEKRDQNAAEMIAWDVIRRPGALVIVFDGDMHVAAPHLPAKVKRILSVHGIKRKMLRVFQNSERIYWRLAENYNEHVDVVKLRRDAFCVMNTAPLVKYQSYLNWEGNREELTSALRSDWMLSTHKSLNHTEQMQQIVRTIAHFFEIKEWSLEDFVVYTTGDLDFLERLKTRGVYTADEMKEITLDILKNESYFITKGHIIYLANLSLDCAAEEAAHFINHQCGGSADRALSFQRDFYYRALKEAIGWVGSKVINPRRTFYKEQDFYDFLRDNVSKKLPPREAEVRSISRYVRQHKAMERRLFKSGGKPTLRRIYNLPLSLHIGVTHALGYLLGERLYEAMLSGEVDKPEIRHLFCVPLHKGDRAFQLYMQYAKRLDAVS
jgi:hypothetical protein